MSGTRVTFSVAVLCALGCCGAARGGPVYAFRKVADTTTLMPGVNQPFTGFGGSAISGDRVFFFGSRGEEQSGLYVSDGSSLKVVIDNTTGIPGLPNGTFQNFGGMSIDGENVSFYGSTSTPQFRNGVYKKLGDGPLTRVADNSMSVSGLGTLTGFSKPVMVGNNVYVYGEGSGQHDEYVITDAGGSVRALAGSGMAIPGHPGTLDILNSNIGAAGGDVAFYNSSEGWRGIYRTRGGALERVADLNTPVPGGQGTFLSFSNLAIGMGDNEVSFLGVDQGGRWGLYRSQGGQIVEVVADGAVVGGSQVRVGYETAFSMDGMNVALSSGGAIYTDLDGSLHKVIGPGSQLLDKGVARVNFGLEGLDDEALTFEAVFTDGSRGVFVAELPGELPPAVPLPPAVVAGTFLGSWILGRRTHERRWRRITQTRRGTGTGGQ